MTEDDIRAIVRDEVECILAEREVASRVLSEAEKTAYIAYLQEQAEQLAKDLDMPETIRGKFMRYTKKVFE